MTRLPSVLLARSTALLLAVLGGCGGRTTFEPADFGTVTSSSPAGSASHGGSAGMASGGTGGILAMGGKPTTPAGPAGGSASGGVPAAGGKGGTAQIPGTGATASAGFAGMGMGGTGALAPELVITNCDIYCKADITSPCSNVSSFTQCEKACVNELASRTPYCQMAGIDLLSCLIKVYQNAENSGACDNIDALSSTKCGFLFDNYRSCFGPAPEPPPDPPFPTQCSSSGSVGSAGCNLAVKCESGAYYNVSCSQTNATQSNCSCSANFPDGSAIGSSLGLNEQATYACSDALTACGFPQPIPK
ncbi:MAG TPA: hypothetical protein VFK05_10495 [Polyangiaceae bacterium]|nr:hypothetical protein [Polyangiaceae bacterium]